METPLLSLFCAVACILLCQLGMAAFTKFIRSREGQSTVELALAFPLLMMVFLAVVEFSHLFYVRLTVESALREAGRYMVTGQTETDQDGTTLPRVDAIKDVFCKYLTGTGLACPAVGSPGFQIEPDDGGGPGDVVTVTATFEKPLFSGVFRLFAPSFPQSITLVSSTTWKNEPFPTP